MRLSSLPSRPSTWRFELLLALALPLAALLLLGQDTNWDLQNYHLYDPFAWWNGRLRLDVAPAQMQSWHNPLLDLPLYLMVRARWPGLAVSLWLLLPAAAAMFVLLRLRALLATRAVARWETTALAALATGGVAFFAEVGTCFNDAFVAAGMLAALWLVLREAPESDRARAWLCAGLVAGATMGLKLTAAPYCIGLAAAAMAMPLARRTPQRLSLLLAGGLAGAALTCGRWSLMLWQLHGNPFFPYYNDLFHSPDASPLPYGDTRFRASGLADALLAPLHLLVASRRFSEMDLRDGRLLAGLLSLAWFLFHARRADASGDTRRIDPSMDALRARDARLRALACFFASSLLLWALQYGVYRYVVPLEMLACLALLLALEGLPPRRRIGGTAIACLLVVALSFPATWGRIHFAPTFVDVRMPALPPGSLVVIASPSPLAFAVTALPADVPAVSVENNFMRPDQCNGLQRGAAARIAANRGPLWLLRSDQPGDDAGEQDVRMFYGLVVAGACTPVANSLAAIRLCPLRRGPRPPPCPNRASATGR